MKCPRQVSTLVSFKQLATLQEYHKLAHEYQMERRRQQQAKGGAANLDAPLETDGMFGGLGMAGDVT